MLKRDTVKLARRFYCLFLRLLLRLYSVDGIYKLDIRTNII